MLGAGSNSGSSSCATCVMDFRGRRGFFIAGLGASWVCEGYAGLGADRFSLFDGCAAGKLSSQSTFGFIFLGRAHIIVGDSNIIAWGRGFVCRNLAIIFDFI